MSNRILIGNPNSLLNSLNIQIVHKHPDYSHRIRSDLDPEEIVAASYPILLANKIVPFLELSRAPGAIDPVPPSRSNLSARHTSTSPSKRTRGNNGNLNTSPVRKISPTKPPLKVSQSERRLSISTATDLPTPRTTPQRQILPLPTLQPSTINTNYTSRTISPGGTLLSPTKLTLITPTPAFTPIAEQDYTTIPTALFTPAPPRVLATAQKRRARGAPSLVEFDTEPRKLLYDDPKMTLTLRHNVSARGLGDVFEWCKRCVEGGRIVGLEGWLIRFRDTGRVREIMEVCAVLGLEKMRVVSEEMLGRLEDLENRIG